jgi:hypothetical protein
VQTKQDKAEEDGEKNGGGAETTTATATTIIITHIQQIGKGTEQEGRRRKALTLNASRQ